MDYYFPSEYHIPSYWPWLEEEAPLGATLFPTTGILDTFSRADSATTIGGNWVVFGRTAGSYDMGISGNKAYNPDGEWNFLYYNQRFGADTEAYVTLSTLQPQGATFSLYVRLKDLTIDVWLYDGYRLTASRYDDGGTDTMALQLFRVDDNVATAISATFDLPNPAAGLKIGLSAVGSSIKAYYDNGAGWVECLEAIDGDYRYGGYTGFYWDSESTSRLDDFGGGGSTIGLIPVMPDVSYVNGIYMSILITDYNGVPLGELAGDVESVAWKLNDVGQARLIAPNPGTAAKLLQIGNRVLIEFDNGLPRWAGYLDPPRRWEYGRVSLTAYSGERILSHRVTSRDSKFAMTTPGGVMTALLREQAHPAIVQPGAIWQGGSAITTEYHFESLEDVLLDLSQTAAVDFAVTGGLEAGRLVFRLHLYESRGVLMRNAYLLEGFNVNVESLEEQGPIVNEWFTAGAGAGWGETGRAYGHGRDTSSLFSYGLRQAAEAYSDINEQATLDTRTASNLAATKDMYGAISLMAINTAPGRFADYDVGDMVNVELYSMPVGGFVGTRRVIGREFRPRDGGCGVLLI